MPRPPLVLVLTLVAFPLHAQRPTHGRCSGRLSDQLATADPPVYLDCQVDKAAKLRGAAPTPDWRPDVSELTAERCYRAALTFVVDTAGQPVVSTIESGASNNRGLEGALRATVSRLRYEPARLDQAAVQQLVVYTTSAMIRVTSSAAGGAGSRPPRC